jgi:signal transduction histidine kinase
MHDVLAHRLSLLAVHAGALEVRRSAPEAERRAAGVVRECAYGALEDLRAAIGMLHDDAPADADRPQPTLTDLPALIEQSRLAGTSLPGASTGLIGLRERMDLVGGRLEHGRTAAGEFRLRAEVPWRP